MKLEKIKLFKRVNRVLERERGYETETVILVGRSFGRDPGVVGRRHPVLFFCDAPDDDRDGPVHDSVRTEDPHRWCGKSPCRQDFVCLTPSQGRLTDVTPLPHIHRRPETPRMVAKSRVLA